MIDPTIILLANATVEKRLSKELAKIYAAKGIVGPKGEPGDVGKQGDKGESVKGDVGLKGDKGEKGDVGKQGDRGSLGLKGDKGDTGEKGDKGDTGQSGLGVSGISLSPDGSIVVIYTDGTSKNIGQAQINNVTNVSGGGTGIPLDHYVINSVSVVSGELIIGCNNNKKFVVTLPSGGGGGVSDGTKGDIIVSGSGTIWAVGNNAITNAKLADVPTSTIKGRITAALGDPEDLTPTQARTVLNVADGATANSTDAALRDRSTHTGTQAASSIGNFQSQVSLNVDVTANTAKVTNANHTGEVTGSSALTITPDAVSNVKLANMAVNTLKGRITAGTGDPEDLTATQATSLLDLASLTAKGLAPVRSGVATEFLNGTGVYSTPAGGGGGVTAVSGTAPIVSSGGTAPAISIVPATSAVPGSMSAADKLKLDGVATGATANSTDASLRDRSTHTNTQLAATISDFSSATAATAAVTANTAKVTNATHTGEVTGSGALTITNDAVTNLRLANMNALTIKGNNTGVSADPLDLTATQTTAMLDTFTSAAKGLVPASGGGTVNFLRADGTFATPAGGGSAIAVQDEGSAITAALATLNFVGAGVTVTGGTTAVVTISADGLAENLQTGATYTAALVDANKAITMNSASAKTLTIALNATVAFPVATTLFPFNSGAGPMTVQFTGTATVNGVAAGSFVLPALCGATVWQTATDVWRALVQPRMSNSGELVLASIVTPPAPATNEVSVFREQVANVPSISVIGPDARPRRMQFDILKSGTGLWIPSGGGTVAPGLLGFQTFNVTGSTATARNAATTNYFTGRRRQGYVSAATAASVATWRAGNNLYRIGTGAGVGGFMAELRFGISDASAVAGARMFFGMASSTVAPTNVEPNTLINSIGIGHGAADTNLSIYFGGSTAQTPINLGVNFPANTLSVDMYELALYAAPNTQTCNYQVTRLNTGQVASGVLSGVAGVALPASTVLMNWTGYRTNNATALAVGFDICSAAVAMADE